MFKPLTRSSKTTHRPSAGFAETQFAHTAGDDDYSGFAPTEMFDDSDELPAIGAVAATPESTRAAASRSHSALERAAGAHADSALPATAADEPSIPQSWVTSQWVAAQEAKAHEAANQARAVIAAQRRAEEQAGPADAAASAVPRTGLGRLRAAFERLLPGEFRSLLPAVHRRDGHDGADLGRAAAVRQALIPCGGIARAATIAPCRSASTRSSSRWPPPASPPPRLPPARRRSSCRSARW